MLPQLWRNTGPLADASIDDFFERFFYGRPSLTSDVETTWIQRVDVNDAEKEILLDIELPGLEKKDIKVEVKNNMLTISGERKQEKKTEDAEYSRVERRYGKFERTFELPANVKSDKVYAEYKNGVLNLTLPKTEKTIPKQIDIAVK